MPAIIAALLAICTFLATGLAPIMVIFTSISIFLVGTLSTIGAILAGIGAFLTAGLGAVFGIFASLTAFIGQALTFLNPWFMLMAAIQYTYDFFTFLFSLGSSPN